MSLNSTPVLLHIKCYLQYFNFKGESIETQVMGNTEFCLESPTSLADKKFSDLKPLTPGS